MTQEERSSLMRIVVDLIKADAIIDSREIEWLARLREKYRIRQTDEVEAAKMTLEEAVNTTAEMETEEKADLMGDFRGAAMSDDFCAREEALLILALETVLSPDAPMEATILSAEVKDGIDMDDAQVLYTESCSAEEANAQIADHYREIWTELRLAGFDFVYLPQVAAHYREVEREELKSIIGFLFPEAGESRAERAVERICNLQTANFCKDYLVAKMGLDRLKDCGASLLVKIGNNRVNGKPYANFLHLELTADVLGCVRGLVDEFSKLYKTRVLNYLEEASGRFVYAGFYKQVIDLVMLRRAIRSRVVADAAHREIRLTDADVVLNGLSRREKTLYTLLLMESPSGGINFTPPASDVPRIVERYNRRMRRVQEKYAKIYHLFGGDAAQAPDLSDAKTRLPMLSHIRRHISDVAHLLHNPDDYLVQRNHYGNYAVNLDAELCLCYDAMTGRECMFSESESWSRILAM